MNEDAQVVAVAADGEHRFSKPPRDWIELVAGLGVRGDAHAGVTVKHRSRVARDPTAANLRQVHLIHAELFDELRDKGFAVAAGDMGENIVTRGLALLDLPVGTLLVIGEAELRLTGLRNPCAQIDGLARGLMAAVLDRDAEGGLVRKAGVMAVVERGGTVAPGMAIVVVRPPAPWMPLPVV